MSKKNREVIERAQAGGLMPLDVMLITMRAHASAERWDQAAAVARDAAPYLHPRLQAIEHKGDAARPLQVVVVRFADLPGDEADDPKLIEHE